MPENRVPPEKRLYARDVSTRKQRARHSFRRDPHMFTVIRKDSVEFWYGIKGPNGGHRRFVVPLDVAYAFFRRHTAKLERIYERRKQPLPVVPLDDIEEFVSDALQGLPQEGENDERGRENSGNAEGGTQDPDTGTGTRNSE